MLGISTQSVRDVRDVSSHPLPPPAPSMLMRILCVVKSPLGVTGGAPGRLPCGTANRGRHLLVPEPLYNMGDTLIKKTASFLKTTLAFCKLDLRKTAFATESYHFSHCSLIYVQRLNEDHAPTWDHTWETMHQTRRSVSDLPILGRYCGAVKP